MKLQHSKQWYEEHIAAEGNAEIGAGIPPWSPRHARPGIPADILSRAPVLPIRGNRRVFAAPYPETPASAFAVHEGEPGTADHKGRKISSTT